MSYCPKCGNKVDETMAFCPNCGFSLKTGTYQAPPPPFAPARNRNEKQEKQEKQEKSQQHEKGQHGYFGWIIAGLLLLFFGFVYFTDAIYHWVPTGAMAGAFWLLVIGVIIIIVGVYFGTRGRKQFPAPTQ